MCSGIGCLTCFNSLSKQVAISSMHIQTSESVMKHPKHRTISCDKKLKYMISVSNLALTFLKLRKLNSGIFGSVRLTLQSWDLSTTSKSMKIRFVSSWFPVRRICFTAITCQIENIVI